MGGWPFVRIEGAEGWMEHTYCTSEFTASDEALLKWKSRPNNVTFPFLSEKQDFINCVKSRKETLIPAEVGHRAATMCQIVHSAIETWAKLKRDPQTERFVGHDAANKLLTRPHRAPWTLQPV